MATIREDDGVVCARLRLPGVVCGGILDGVRQREVGVVLRWRAGK